MERLWWIAITAKWHMMMPHCGSIIMTCQMHLLKSQNSHSFYCRQNDNMFNNKYKQIITLYDNKLTLTAYAVAKVHEPEKNCDSVKLRIVNYLEEKMWKYEGFFEKIVRNTRNSLYSHAYVKPNAGIIINYSYLWLWLWLLSYTTPHSPSASFAFNM